MVNKNFCFEIPVLIFGIMLALTGCVTARGVMNLGDNADTDAGIGESEIIISSPVTIYGSFGEDADMTVTLDGKLKGIMRGNGTAKFIVPDGEHVLKIVYRGTGINTTFTSYEFVHTFTVNSERVEFKPVFDRKRTIQLVNTVPLKPKQ